MISYHTNDCNYVLKGKRICSKWLKETALSEGFAMGDISYIFCSSESHREINRTYLKHDYFTDVITFDDTIYSSTEGEQGVVNGDIFIDYKTVGLNAKEFGSDSNEELFRIIVHGLLHLCGYKDKSPEDEKQMREKENKYLSLFFNKEIK